MFFGYVDFTADDYPFYVGIGCEPRLKLLKRNTKHTGVRKKHGHRREVFLVTSDYKSCKRWEVETIAELGTYHYDCPEGIGCNFTRGGDGALGWKPSDETRALWSNQRKGNKWGVGGNEGKRKPRPKQSEAMKGRKRPDLSVIMTGKKRGPYDLTDESRFALGSSHRGKQLSDEHRQRLSESTKGRPKSEETKQKMRKFRSPETRERMRLAALKRWEKRREHKANHQIPTDTPPSR